MTKIYTCTVHLETKVVEDRELDFPDQEDTDSATFDSQDGSVYAESSFSPQRAKKLAYDECFRLQELFCKGLLAARPEKPKTLADYHAVPSKVYPGGTELHVVDPLTKTHYRIYWCANGRHSHFYVQEVASLTNGFRVYVHEPVEPLFAEIYHKEQELVHNVPPDQIKCPYRVRETAL